jgi:hypothetical protein
MAILCTLVFLLFWCDRFRLEPLPWMAAVAGWSLAGPLLLLAVGSRLPAVLNEPASGRAIPEMWLTPALLAVVLPCIGVALPLVAVAKTRVVEGPSGGAALGVVAGLSFSGGMQILLLSRTSLRPGGTALAFVYLLHSVVGAAFGVGVGMTRLSSRPALRVPAVLAATGVATSVGALLCVGATSCWSSWGEDNVACNLALTGVAAAVLVVTFAGAFSYEQRVLEGQLTEEVELGVLPRWVAEIVPSYPRRVRSEWWRRRDERREIVRLLVTIAFRKHRLGALPEDRARLYGLEVGRLRHRARAVLSDAGPGPSAHDDAWPPL